MSRDLGRVFVNFYRTPKELKTGKEIWFGIWLTDIIIDKFKKLVLYSIYLLLKDSILCVIKE